MKRILLGLGCALAAGAGGVLAQDSAPPHPAARLGSPAATLGRPVPTTVRAQSPDVTNAGGASIIPKIMPKGSVAESSGPTVPGTLPVPAAAPPLGGPVVTIPPGAGPVTGPVILGPGAVPPGPVVSAPVPSGAIPMGPIMSTPMAGCPGGCPVPMGVPAGSDETGWYTSVEALLWYVKSYSVPALVTTGPTPTGATLSTPGTVVLNNDSIDTNPRYGVRGTLGHWLSPQWAVELTAFYTRTSDTAFRASSGQYPDLDLARPFFSLNRGIESSEIVGRPGVVSGAVIIAAEQTLYGGELNGRYRLWEDCGSSFDLLAGGRFIFLEEDLTITERLSGISAGTAGLERLLFDRFTTRNLFYGLQVGSAYTYREGPWTVGLTAKVAVGITRQEVDIAGSVSAVSGGAPPTLPGGLLALTSNIGTHTNNRLSVVPEFALNVGYDVTDRLRVYAGYSFLYWTNVARPGSQIDRVLDENRIPDFPAAPATTGVRPAPRLESENVWIQGVHVGVLWKW